MKKAKFASMLAVAGGLALATSACDPDPERDPNPAPPVDPAPPQEGNPADECPRDDGKECF